MAKNEPARRQAEPSPYFSPTELAERWKCSRTSVDRIARRQSFTAVLLGEGKNGMVRYSGEEVLAFEESRKIRLSL